MAMRKDIFEDLTGLIAAMAPGDCTLTHGENIPGRFQAICWGMLGLQVDRPISISDPNNSWTFNAAGPGACWARHQVNSGSANSTELEPLKRFPQLLP